MTELRLNRELYDEAAVTEAVALFGRFGADRAESQPSHWIVQIAGPTPARERHVTRELANYALGLTIKGRKAS